MRFIIFVIDDESRSGGPDEMKAIDAFNEKLRDGGHWVLAAGLESPPNSLVIDNRGKQAIVNNGSLFDNRDFYSGLWIIEAPDLATATNLAHEGSAACNRRVELRPFL
ncbi:MAG: YciI family protein [Microbacteriaceae bacterium]|nr:YciI family protein [Microbacteriaceae bacterium]